MAAEAKAGGGGPGLIGLTGKYCAGKNRAAALLEGWGLAVADLDKMGHEALASRREDVLARFGPDVAGPDGLIDRRRLGAKVFGKPAELAALEGIVHPEVDRILQAWLERQGGGGGGGGEHRL